MAVGKSGGASSAKSTSRKTSSAKAKAPAKTGSRAGTKSKSPKAATSKTKTRSSLTPSKTSKTGKSKSSSPTDSTKVSKEARSSEKLSPQRKAHLSALEGILDEPTSGADKADAPEKSATAKETSKDDAKAEAPEKSTTAKETSKDDAKEAAPVTPDTPPASGPGVIDFTQKTADKAKVLADRVKGAAKALKDTVGTRAAVDSATRATEKQSGKFSRRLHGAAALAGGANLLTNMGSMNANELAATGSGVLADSAGALDNGGRAVTATTRAGRFLGGARTVASKVAGPLGIAAKGFEGANQLVNGETKSERTEGAFKTAAAIGTTKVSLAAWAGGAARLAAKTNVVGAAAISGIEGIGQLSRAETTQDTIAGSLKTGAAVALGAAAVPGFHTVPLAIAGAGLYAGGVVADNWDTVTWAGGVVADGASAATDWAGDKLSDAGGAIASGWSSLFN